MIDLHSHLLPGVDDGSRTAAQSARVLRSFAGKGITDVCCTPHLLASHIDQGWPANYEAAWTRLGAEAPAQVRLHRGAEVMLDRPIPGAAAERRVTLGGSRYLLVEFARMVPADIVARALTEVIRCGLVPVLAHPERYSSCSIETVQAWRDLGSVIQVDATTVTLPRRRGERARELVFAGLADILAADNHGDERSVATALDWLADLDAAEQATLLLETNPRAILDDLSTYEVDPLPVKRSVWRSMRRIFRSE
ncbi:MAG: CpsB/CapC family capsule biosynthesis tyrosine phosphatase [Gemmatimonadales bacterium]